MPRPLSPARNLIGRARSSLPALVAVAVVAALGLGSVSYAAIVVTGVNVKNGSLTGRDVKDRTLAGTDIKKGSLKGKHLKDGSVTGSDLAPGTIKSVHLAPGVSIGGPAGPAGPAGANGAAGPAGAQGPQGPQGLQGPQGDDGVDGADGADGADGQDGQDGTNGLSTAYFASGDNVTVTTSATTVAQVQVPAGIYVISAGTMIRNLGLGTTATCTLTADGTPIAGDSASSLLALGGALGSSTTFSFGDARTFAGDTTLRLACTGTGVPLDLKADSGYVSALKVNVVNPAP